MANIDTDLIFETLADAENALLEQGFELVPGTCDWLSPTRMIDAGVYPVRGDDGKEVYRVEYCV